MQPGSPLDACEWGLSGLSMHLSGVSTDQALRRSQAHMEEMGSAQTPSTSSKLA